VGWGEAPPSAAVGTPIPLPAPHRPWRCSAPVQRPGQRGELCRRRPPPPSAPPRHRCRASGDGRRQGRAASPGCCARVGVGSCAAPPPLLPHRHHHAPGVAAAAAAAALTADGTGCSARAALGSSAVGRRRQTDQTSRPPWAAALQHPGALSGPGQRPAPPPPSPPRAPPRHRRRAPGDAAAASAYLVQMAICEDIYKICTQRLGRGPGCRGRAAKLI
jgi:hypothetical protein